MEEQRHKYIFFDPETHWCQICNVFPTTARDYLNHLHSKEHMDRESLDTPWHAIIENDVSSHFSYSSFVIVIVIVIVFIYSNSLHSITHRF